jgi:hypothetical protein
MHGRSTVAGVAGLLLAFVGLPSGSAWAQHDGGVAADVKPIGRVVTVAGTATIQHVGAAVVQASLSDETAAQVNDPVYRGDVVRTGADGRLGLNFADGSSFNLSSNARMELNEFVYDPASTSNSTFFSLAKGTFTFVAGKIAKTGDMKVDTPVATMGIRGTTPHIEISDDGTVRFATLIEEGKDSILKRKTAPAAPPGRQRRAERGLGVCRGC